MSDQPRSLEKVIFKLPPNSWHGHSTETVWAERVGPNRYRLRSVPFYAKGVGLYDVVMTDSDDGKPVVERIAIHGGHSTYRLFLAQIGAGGKDLFQQYWQPLENLGCTFERATARLLAVDVPPNVRVREAYDLLAKGEADGVWEFEEGHCASPVTQ